MKILHMLIDSDFKCPYNYPIMLKRTLASFLAVMMVFTTSLTWAQQPGNALISEAPQEAEKDVTAVEVKGNESISLSKILSRIKTRVGQDYQKTVISDDLKRLYNTGYFSDVRVDRQPHEGGFKVIFYVEEKPVVDEITFSDIRYYKPAYLKRQIRTQEGKFFDQKILRDDISLIEELYEKKGLTLANVRAEQTRDEVTNKVDLHFVIKEGQRVRVRRIIFHGNETFRDKRLMKVIKTRPDGWFNSGYLKEQVLEEDIQRIKGFYEKDGFIDVKVRHEYEDFNKEHINVHIYIEQGKQYFVDSVQVTGNEVFTNDEIISVMEQIKTGEVFSPDRLSLDIAEIRSMYFDEGYIFAQVRDSVALNSETGRVAVRLDIMEGELAYVNKIKIQGNTRTRDIVIRRELRLYPGDRFDGEKLRRSKERLQNLGYFQNVAYDTEQTSRGNYKNLVVNVEEAKTGSFNFGGGYSTVDSVVGFVEIEQKNFDFTNWPTFTGGGQNLTFRAETGSTRNNFRLSFTEPWLFDYPVSGGFDLYMTERDRERDVGYAFDESRKGGRLRFGKQISEYVTGGLAYRYENIEIDNFDDDVSADLLKEEGENNLSELGFSLARDTRDSVFNPTSGLYLSGNIDIAGGPMLGDKDYYRVTTKTSYNIPLKWKSVLELRLRTGVMDNYGDSDQVPIYERFYAGGARTIRGYDERKVGPLDSATDDPIGGESLLVGNVEWTIPVLKFMKAAAFYDIGNVWSDMKDFATQDLKSGVGMGLRFKTPIGPINLDYGYPLDNEPGEESKSGKFYFSVSRGF